MQRVEGSAVRWSFHLHEDGRWTWLLGGADGMPDQVSGRCASFGTAIADAVRHGFNPERHLWAIANRDWQGS